MEGDTALQLQLTGRWTALHAIASKLEVSLHRNGQYKQCQDHETGRTGKTATDA